jgi:hypothetical protein
MTTKAFSSPAPLAWRPPTNLYDKDNTAWQMKKNKMHLRNVVAAPPVNIPEKTNRADACGDDESVRDERR